MPAEVMSQNAPVDKFMPVKALVISCLAISLLFAWQGSKGFSLWDEGFLWYGVQRVMQGEIPIRDFMAYDPGRYYWSAALLSIAGENGVMALRASVAVFQVFGLAVGLLLVAPPTRSQSKADAIFWIMAAVTLVVWMYPRHKLFDISLSIFQIGILTFLIMSPVPKRYIVAGVCVGLAAVFGRNHGLYGAVSSLGVIAWLNVKSISELGFLKGLTLWGIGVTIGFLPVILMVLLIPGFAIAFWESIRFFFELNATNLTIPVPWPWTVDFVASSAGEALRGLLIGAFFIGTLLFGVLALLWVFQRRPQDQPIPPAFVAAAFLALPYAHYAFARADVGHLAHGIFPLLVGSLVILSRSAAKIKWPLGASLCVASVWVMYVFHPGWQCRSSSQCANVEISGSNLQVDLGIAAEIALLRKLVETHAENGRSFIATPFWPAAYALLERKSPMWEIYALFPRSEKFEKEEIERIKVSNPGFAVVFDFALDGRDDRRFKNTHPLINKYIFDNFEQTETSLNPALQIYKRGKAHLSGVE